MKERNMKNKLKTYKEFVNESVRDLMKPKSTEEILKSLGDLEPNEILIKSVKNDFIEGIKFALKRGADPSINYNSAIRWASEYGYIEIVKLLLNDSRIDPSANNNFLIKWTSENGHLEVVKLLLEDKRVDPSVDNNYVIKSTSLNGRTKIVKLLLNDKRVDPSVDNNYAIRYASEYGHIEVVKLLLQDKRVRKNLTENEIKKFERQIKNLNESVRDFLKPKSVEEILKSLGELSPNEMLIKSVKNNFVEGVKIALERGADPSAFGNWSIRTASSKGYTEVVKLLLQDPRVDPSDFYNYAIRVASEKGYIEIVELLLNDDRVREKLSDKEIKKYEDQIERL